LIFLIFDKNYKKHRKLISIFLKYFLMSVKLHNIGGNFQIPVPFNFLFLETHTYAHLRSLWMTLTERFRPRLAAEWIDWPSGCIVDHNHPLAMASRWHWHTQLLSPLDGRLIAPPSSSRGKRMGTM